MKIKYSVIVPIFNEAENLRELHQQLFAVMKGMKQPFEILYINDGSTDTTGEILQNLSQIKEVRVITLRRNSGKSFVYNIGFQKANGEIIITIDADLQDDPQEIPHLIRTLNINNDFVIGWRKNREDKKCKILGSQLFNLIINKIFKTKFHDIDSGLKVFTKKSLAGIYLHGDFHRYLPLILTWNGFKGIEVAVKHRMRKYGKTKYSYTKILNTLYDLFSAWFIWRFSQKPMHLFGAMGVVLFGIGTLINFYLLLVKLGGESIGNRPLLFLGILLTLSGIQFVTTGFIADLIIRSRTWTNINNYIRE